MLDITFTIIQRSWWTRTWTIQEVALATQAYGLCGSTSMPFDSFVSTLSQSFITDPSFRGVIETKRDVGLRLLNLHHSMKRTVAGEAYCITDYVPGNLVDIIRMCGSSDPKDKVFALHGIFLSLMYEIPPPDYSKSAEEVYLDATRALPLHGKPLAILHLVTGLEDMPNIPAWVPNFSERDLPWLIHHTARELVLFDSCFEAPEFARPHILPGSNGRYLCLRGNLLDKVSIRCEGMTWQPDFSEILTTDILSTGIMGGFHQIVRAFQEWYRVVRRMNRYPFQRPLNRVFLHTLVHIESDCKFEDSGGELWLRTLMSNDPEMGAGVDSLKLILDEVAQDVTIKEAIYDNPKFQHMTQLDEWKILLALVWDSEMCGFHDRAWIMSRHNVFFTTEAGYMGAGSRAIQSGDLLVHFPGTVSPMIIRPSGKHYRLIAQLLFTV
jgi:hypothetical protein